MVFVGCSFNSKPKSTLDKNALPGIPAITEFFRALPQGQLDLSVDSPGSNYLKDPAEKDALQGMAPNSLRFFKLSIFLSPVQEIGKALVEMAFVDQDGNRFLIHGVDLLDLVPAVGQKNGLQKVEYLLKEFERFGILYYKKERAISWEPGMKLSLAGSEAMDRTYQAGIFNNCLEAGKWELVINTKYFEKFDSTQAKPSQYQRYRVLAHSWFTLDQGLYRLLMKTRNPTLAIDPYTPYDSLVKQAETEVIPFAALGRIKRSVETQVLELGHRSKRELFELDEEEMYKDWFDLVLNRDQFHTYSDVLETPVRLAKFTEKGFYRPEDAQTFDYGWMKKLDRIDMDIMEAAGPDRFARIKIWGEQSPYMIVLGSFDLGRLNPDKTIAMQFGVNPFPKLRLQRKTPFGTGYNLGPDGKEIQPYLLLVERSTGRWVNNQKLGLEQTFIGWQSVDKKALLIHLVTYERMLPVWMARLGIGESERKRGGIANAFFQSSDSSSYPEPLPTIVRKEREAYRAKFAGMPATTDTVVLDFESLSHDDAKLEAHGFFYEEKGFTLLSGGFLTGQPFRSIGKKGYPFTGSTALINGERMGINYLMKRDEFVKELLDLDDNLFGLISLDLARFDNSAIDSITFVGVKRDSSTVSQAFKLDPGYAKKTLTFNSKFQEVATVRWVSRSTQIDNIKIRKGAKRRLDFADGK